MGFDATCAKGLDVLPTCWMDGGGMSGDVADDSIGSVDGIMDESLDSMNGSSRFNWHAVLSKDELGLGVALFGFFGRSTRVSVVKTGVALDGPASATFGRRYGEMDPLSDRSDKHNDVSSSRKSSEHNCTLWLDDKGG